MSRHPGSIWFPVLLFVHLAASPTTAADETPVNRVSPRAEGSPDYDYGPEKGPLTWPTRFPEFCSGSRQSPIDIPWHSVSHDFDDKPIRFINYDLIPDSMTLTNSGGHTAEVKVVSKSQPYIEKGPLGDDEYVFEQFHFHWGANSNRGSEHTLDGYRFPMEMHLVHWNRKYGSFEKARSASDGLAVMAILFEINNDYRYIPRIINEVATHLPEIKNANSKTALHPTPILTSNDPIGSFYPYFVYDGSLTTPNCAETVKWLVFRKPFAVTEKQMRNFRQLLTADGEPLVDNFRPVQDLNGRTIHYEFPIYFP